MAEQNETSSPTISDLPNPTRVVTPTNLENGVPFDSSFDESLGVLNGSDLDTYGGHPKNVPHLVTPGGGANVWYIDTPPGVESPLHRTVSLDFVIVVEGELQLILDSGEMRVLKPGDLVIQRGTARQWKNVSKDKWVRMIGAMVAIQPIALNDGTKLGVSGLG
ncbi:hypothetical protein ANO14919_001900 [Xylariales sp. No.14919]|nr:hypothetical protein ANO14919_001900 [Xylariales sp. No.14919]